MKNINQVVDNYLREIELLTLEQYGNWFKPTGTRMKKIRKNNKKSQKRLQKPK